MVILVGGMSMTHTVIPGAEAWSHVGSGDVGALVIHGFTGNPSSMREVAEVFGAAGFHVELPRLAGHGTTVEDMMDTRWADWTRDAEQALTQLRSRCSKIVVIGLSMGGAITLWLASRHADLSGIVCINPTTKSSASKLFGARLAVKTGKKALPAIGSDIADPAVKESSYDATPLAAAVSLFADGLKPLSKKYPAITTPLLLITSKNDHVVKPQESEFLMSTYGGTAEQVLLERSFHVATQDFEKDVIHARALEFAKKVTV
jgi:carboxylesterase